MGEEQESQELPEIDESVVGQGDVESEAPAAEGPGASSGLGLIAEVPLRLSVELGSAQLPVKEVLALSKGSVVELNRMNGEPADIFVNDRLIARGELTTQDDRVAVRVTELVAVQAGSGEH